MADITDLIDKRPTVMSRYGIYFTFLYFIAFFCIINIVRHDTDITVGYKYIKDNVIQISLQETEYHQILSNDCSIIFMHGNTKYNVHSEILHKTFNNGYVLLTLRKFNNNNMSKAENGILVIKDVNTTIGSVIWKGINKSIKF